MDAIHTFNPVTGKINTDKRPLDENTIFQQLYGILGESSNLKMTD